jgi:hypothetical protein
MAVTVKKAILWRSEVDNSSGMLANILQPLSEAGADLQVVMAYRYPDGENKAAIELYPVSGKKSAAAAQTASRPFVHLHPGGRGRQSAGARPRDRQSGRRCGDQHELRDGAGSGPKILGGVRLRERG